MRKPIAAVFSLAGLAAFAWGLYHLMKIGTCASGGPYVSARPCPAGTGQYFAGLFIGIWTAVIAMMVGGFAAYILPVVFTAVGGASLAAAFAGDADSGSKTFLIIFGGAFLFFGLVPAILVGGFMRGSRSSRKAAFDTSSIASTPPSFTGLAPAPAGSMFGVNSPPASGTAMSAAGAARVAAPAMASPWPDSGGDAIDKLEKLDKLHKSGALTDAEFETQKRKLLGEM